MSDVISYHENKWLSLRAIPKGDGDQDYVFSHETRCQGKIVLVLPYRYDIFGDVEFLIRSEITPCWSSEYVNSGITGGYEGGDITDDAVRELLEEGGYSISKESLIPLGTCFASKSADTVYYLFAVNLTGYEQSEILGDGSSGEVGATVQWLPLSKIIDIQDAQLSTAVFRFILG